MLSYHTDWVTSSRKYWAGDRSHRNSQIWPTLWCGLLRFLNNEVSVLCRKQGRTLHSCCCTKKINWCKQPQQQFFSNFSQHYFGKALSTLTFTMSGLLILVPKFRERIVSHQPATHSFYYVSQALELLGVWFEKARYEAPTHRYFYYAASSLTTNINDTSILQVTIFTKNFPRKY